jgi:Fur family peroxide stress response transcriptional regulator
MSSQYKRSVQRERILQLLQGTGIHPTAGWVYDRLKKEFPNLSMGTVYRNLNILVEQGKVRRIDFGSTFDRYDANISQHYHFICERCGSITDLYIPIDQELNHRVNKATNFETRRHRIEFFGLCDRCREETKDE